MNLNKKGLKDIDVKGKKVLVRVDFNVPMSRKMQGKLQIMQESKLLFQR